MKRTIYEAAGEHDAFLRLAHAWTTARPMVMGRTGHVISCNAYEN